MTETKFRVTKDALERAVDTGIGKELVLPGLPRSLVMVEYVVYDLNTAEFLMQRSEDGRWWGSLPQVWMTQLEELYRANFG